MQLIVTGFGKFGGVEHNPTERLIELLEERTADANALAEDDEGTPPHLKTKVLRVAAQEVKEWIECHVFQKHEEGEAIVVHLGVDSKAECLRLERQAFNEANFRIPDEGGWQPEHERILDTLPLGARLLTRLPLHTLLDSLQRKGYPVVLSKDAGRFVCNWAYCVSLAHCSHRTKPPPAGRAWNHSGISGSEQGSERYKAQHSGERQGQPVESGPGPESDSDTLATPAASTDPSTQGERWQQLREGPSGAGLVHLPAAAVPSVPVPDQPVPAVPVPDQPVPAVGAVMEPEVQTPAPTTAAAAAAAGAAAAAATVDVLGVPAQAAGAAAVVAAPAGAAPAPAGASAAAQAALEAAAQAALKGAAQAAALEAAEADMESWVLVDHQEKESADQEKESADQQKESADQEVSSSEDEGLQEGTDSSWHRNRSYALFVHVPPFEVVPEQVQFSFLLDLLHALVRWARAEEIGQQEGIDYQEAPLQQYAQV